MDNEIKNPTHIVLIGRFCNCMEWKTEFSIPCFSLKEAEEYCEKYKIYGKSINHQTLIAEYI